MLLQVKGPSFMEVLFTFSRSRKVASAQAYVRIGKGLYRLEQTCRITNNEQVL